jgi:hypothetical protein
LICCVVSRFVEATDRGIDGEPGGVFQRLCHTHHVLSAPKVFEGGLARCERLCGGRRLKLGALLRRLSLTRSLARAWRRRRRHCAVRQLEHDRLALERAARLGGGGCVPLRRIAAGLACVCSCSARRLLLRRQPPFERVEFVARVEAGGLCLM